MRPKKRHASRSEKLDRRGLWSFHDIGSLPVQQFADRMGKFCPDCAKKSYPEFDLYPETKGPESED